MRQEGNVQVNCTGKSLDHGIVTINTVFRDPSRAFACLKIYRRQ